MEGNLHFKISQAYAVYTDREIYVSKSIGNRLEDVYKSYQNSAMQVLCLFGTRKSKLRVKNELCKQQYTCTVTLFDCIHLAQVKVLCQMPEIMRYCTVFALFYFDDFQGNFQVQAVGGLCLGACIAFSGSSFESGQNQHTLQIIH